eukprot:4336862-Pyramimonas_sp.AAC.1
MCLVKLWPTTKPCCAQCVRSASADLIRKLAAPAMALISVFSRGGRASVLWHAVRRELAREVVALLGRWQ